MAIPSYARVDRKGQALFYDPRSTLQKFLQVSSDYPVYLLLPVISLGFLVLIPGAFIFCVLITFIYRLMYKHIADVLPLFLPVQSKSKYDLNNKIPSGIGKPDGKVYWGRLLDNNLEIWTKLETALRHILVLGTTGAGKSEFLLSTFFSHVFAKGVGGIYNDGKGTAELAYRVFSAGRMLGQEDDVLILNYTKENTAERVDPANFQSHTCAPFSTGSSDNGTQLTVSLMPEDSGGGNKVFQESAVALIAVLFPALTDLRELGIVSITPAIIQKYSDYLRFCELMRNPLISNASREGMIGFIRTRSGFTEGKPADKQPEEVTKQFGFAQAYFTRALQLLAQSYRNIYNEPAADVDFTDIILNDRVLVNILPSMSKSPQEMGNLGKLNLSSIRAGLSIGLGADIQGTYEEVVEALPTNTEIPVMCINDEIAFYLAEGFMITSAQARSLKMIMIFSSQEFASIMDANKKEGEQMWANTRLKFLMASEGDKETIQRFIDSAGKTWAYLRTGLQRNENQDGFMSREFSSGNQINLQQVDKMEVDDVRELTEGRAAMLYQENLYLIKTTYHSPPNTKVVNKMAEQMRILSGVVPIFEPDRGIYKNVLSSINITRFPKIKTFVRNYQANDIPWNDYRAPSTRSVVVKDLKANFDPENNWSASEYGIAMINGFGSSSRIQYTLKNMAEMAEQEEQKNEAVLFNASGDFGGDQSESSTGAQEPTEVDEASGAALIAQMFANAEKGLKVDFTHLLNAMGDDEPDQPGEQAADTKAPEKSASEFSLTKLMENSEYDESNPDAKSGNSISYVDDSQLPEFTFEDNEPVDPATDSPTDDSALPARTISRIADGTKRLETLLGASKQEAEIVTKRTIVDVISATQYPKTNLNGSEDTRDKLRKIADDFINKNKGK